MFAFRFLKFVDIWLLFRYKWFEIQEFMEVDNP